MSTSDGIKPLDVQVGGDHYKSMAIQPMEYSMANKLDACQHTIIKYVTRFRGKGGIQDLEKAKHCIDLLIHFERQAATVKESLTVHQAGGFTYHFDPMTPPPSFGQQNMIDPAAVDIESADDRLDRKYKSIVSEQDEPASHIDDDSERQQAMGQNWNGGEHYGAPDWSKAPDDAVLYIDWTGSPANFSSSFYCDGVDRFYRLHCGARASTYVLKRDDGLPDTNYQYFMRQADELPLSSFVPDPM